MIFAILAKNTKKILEKLNKPKKREILLIKKYYVTTCTGAAHCVPTTYHPPHNTPLTPHTAWPITTSHAMCVCVWRTMPPWQEGYPRHTNRDVLLGGETSMSMTLLQTPSKSTYNTIHTTHTGKQQACPRKEGGKSNKEMAATAAAEVVSLGMNEEQLRDGSMTGANTASRR